MKCKLPEGWEEVKLGEVAKLKNGKKAQGIKEAGINEYPLYGGNGQYGSVNEYNSENSLVIGRVGAYCGSVHKVDRKFWISDNAIEVKPLSTKKLVYEYLYYRLNSFNLNRLHQGTSQPLLNQTILKNIEFLLPPLPEQKAIADTLSSLDDKIENNNKINENLENQAQAIFKHWFVDFEFLDENGKPYKSSGGEMVESELGMIPKGWEVVKLGDIIKIANGKRPPVKYEEKGIESLYPILGASGVMGYTNDFLYNEPILVIGRVGTHGVVQKVNDKVWTSDNTMVIKSNYYEFINIILLNMDYKSLNRGSTQPLLVQKDIKNKIIAFPDEKIMKSFNEIIDVYTKKIDINQKQNQKLSQLRDTLLPKLMSGEIRIPLN